MADDTLYNTINKVKPKCWECGAQLTPHEKQRGQCLNCFRYEDGPYEEDFDEEVEVY